VEKMITNKKHLSLSRAEWIEKNFSTVDKLAAGYSSFNVAELSGVNENLNTAELNEIYLPLIHLLIKRYEGWRSKHSDKPFVIGVTGSVAVGKSTASRVLQAGFQQIFSDKKVTIVTTDNFILENKILESLNLTMKKGFPVSFDNNKLEEFLLACKENRFPIKIPIYSHYHYDIIPGKSDIITKPDILIVEGLNILRFQPQVCDATIYLDAENAVIQEWYLKRFMFFREQARSDSKAFSARFLDMSDVEAEKFARQVWRNINEVNLVKHILPYREQANIILHKNAAHSVIAVSISIPL
jgi:type I pantothenate kinase